MKLCSAVPMKVAKYGYVLLSLVFCLAGLALILRPAPSASAVGVFFGITLLLFGLIKIVGYCSRDLFRLAFQYDLQFGILFVILGAIILLRTEEATEFICMTYGVCMIAECLFKIRIALDARQFGIRRWWMTMALAVLGGAAGTLITVCALLDVRGVHVFLGAALLCEGMLNGGTALSLVKIIDHQHPDTVDADLDDLWEED